MSCLEHDIKGLEKEPKSGQIIMADLGDGVFKKFSIIFIGKTVMKIRRVEDGKLETIVKIPLESRNNNAFWYENGMFRSDEGMFERILHYQYTHDEKWG